MMASGVKIALGVTLILIGAASIVLTGVIYFPIWMGKVIRGRI
jgi:hypothetical protein